MGDHFPSRIENVIKTASVHVAIFSPRYAQSEWCLNELVLMLESGAPTIPVFYHVRPNELRREDGKYAEDLRNLENMKTHDNQEKPVYNSTTIKKWKDALSRVSFITGLDLLDTCNGDEGKLVEMIVQSVLKNVKMPGLENSCLVNLDTENDTHMLDRHRHMGIISKAPKSDISQKDNDDGLQQSNDHHTAIPKLPNCGQKRKPKCKRYLASKTSKSPRRKKVYVCVETKYRHPGKSSSEKTDQTEVLSCCKTEPVIVVVSAEKETVVCVGIMIMILRVVLFLMACKLPHPPRKKIMTVIEISRKSN